MNTVPRLALVLLALAFSTPITFAAFDVVPYNDGGQIVTGGHDDFEPDPQLANNEVQRVFGYGFGDVPAAPYVIADPGFNNGTGFTLGYGSNNGALLPSLAASFSLETLLEFWNGSGDVTFDPAPSLVTLGIRNAVTSVEIKVGGSGTTGAIPNIATTTSAGRLHTHLVSSLYYNNETSPTTLPNAPDGIYLLGLSVTQSGLMPSDPIYLVYLNNVEGGLGTFQNAALIHQRAIDWVQDNLVDGLVGDFNADGMYSCLDVDPLVATIAAQSHVANFDLTGDNLVTIADLDVWRSVAGTVLTSSGNPILPGDANLDGVVDGSDFGNWNSAKFTNTAAWCSGDFNADGAVDGTDFGIWNSHKFQTADGASIVPETSACALWLVTFSITLATLRHRKT